jgi:uncharacterized protein YggU (UPF0235/DUF167 family)
MIKVRPRARRPGPTGLKSWAEGPRLGLGVGEPAEDGRANEAVRRAIAALLDVPPAAVGVARGAGRREKLLRVTGDSAALSARLAAL